MGAEIGATVRRYRRLRRVSQEELAASLGLAPNAISKIEHGHRKITLDEAVRLAVLLRVSLEQLAGIEGLARVARDDTTALLARCAQQGRAAVLDLTAIFEDLEALTAV